MPSHAPTGSVPGIDRVAQALLLAGPDYPVSGVVDQYGLAVFEGLTNRKGTFLPLPQPVGPDSLQVSQNLAGRWLFAGEYWFHFGHFWMESLSRLWALDQIAEPLEGIAYLAPRKDAAYDLDKSRFQKVILDHLGVDLPVQIICEPTRFEELFVPRQGLGLGPLAMGSGEIRAFFRNRLSRNIAPASDKRVYLSRSGYGLTRGGLFDEAALEERLVDEGYVIIQPEQLTFAEQISCYMGAEKIISPDSSALHVVACLAQPEQDVAVILRRKQGANDLLPQLAGFMGRPPLIIDRITGALLNQSKRVPSYQQFAALDRAGVWQDLQDHGFVAADSAPWPNLTWRQKRRLVRSLTNDAQGFAWQDATVV